MSAIEFECPSCGEGVAVHLSSRPRPAPLPSSSDSASDAAQNVEWCYECERMTVRHSHDGPSNECAIKGCPEPVTFRMTGLEFGYCDEHKIGVSGHDVSDAGSHTDAELAESYRDGWATGVGHVCVNLGHPVYPNGEGDCACGFFGSTPEVPSAVTPDRSYMKDPVERAIQEAVDRIEEMGAHPLLTNIVVLLGNARHLVEEWNKGVRGVSGEGDGGSARRHSEGTQGASQQARRDDDRSGEAMHRDGGVPGTGGEQRVAAAGGAEEGPQMGATGSAAPVGDSASDDEIEDVIADALVYGDPSEKLVFRWSDDRHVLKAREVHLATREIREALQAKGFLSGHSQAEEPS